MGVSAKWKKQFIILWSGQAVSILTSSVIQMAIIWYLTDKTGSAAVLSVASLSGFLPRAIIGPFAGVLIDRYNRKHIMMIADGVIAAFCLILAIAGLFGDPPIWLIMVILFGRSLGAAFHSPSLQAVIPLLVPKESLVQYAGYAQGFESISLLLSPGIAAALYRLFPLNRIIMLDIAGAIFAVSMLAFVKIPSGGGERAASLKAYIGEFKQGFSVLGKERGIVALTVVSSLYAMIYFPVGTYYPLMTMTHFQKGIDESALVETVFSLGSLAGSFGLGIVGKRINKMKALSLSIAVYGTGLIVSSTIPNRFFAVFVVMSAVMGASVPFYTGIKTAVIQKKFQDEYLGRILSLVGSLTMAAMPVGLILAGVFAEITGIGNWFFISGVLAVVLSLFSFFAPSMKDRYM